MVFGHNSNLKIGGLTLHVQTEDRGAANGLIDTAVYYRGRVLHRRTSNYFDLLPLDDDREQALKLRLDEQHRTVIEEIRSGALQLNVSTLLASPGCDAQVSSAQVLVEIEGNENGQVHRAETSPQGLTLIEFDMPPISSPEATLLIRAEHPAGSGQLRFALRAKTRVPSV